MATKETAHVTESVSGALGVHNPETPRRVGNVVKGCKILGRESKKGRTYRTEAIRNAISLYEGKAVFIDHPNAAEVGNPRSFVSKFGAFRNIVIDGVGEMFGDLHYNPKHMLAPTFEGWVDTLPEEVGFSHSAVCEFEKNSDGSVEVTEIKRVLSVDLVATPATTGGLFESEYSMDFPPTAAPAPMPAANPAPTPAEAPAGLDAALSALIASIMADATLDPAMKRTKILAALNIIDPVEEVKPAPKEEAPKPKEEAPKEEIPKPKEEAPKEESIALLIEKTVGKLLTEALANYEVRTKDVKPPISHPPARVKGDVPLTVDGFMAGLRS